MHVIRDDKGDAAPDDSPWFQSGLLLKDLYNLRYSKTIDPYRGNLNQTPKPLNPQTPEPLNAKLLNP